jgi:hypothetical protein
MPLHIFEPRYRGLVQSLLDLPEDQPREFGVIAVHEGRSVEADGAGALYPIGTTGILREAEELPDGRFNIVTTGGRRFRVTGVDVSQPLATASVDFLEEPLGDVDPGLALAVARRFTAYRQILGGRIVDDEGADPDDTDLPADPTVLSYLVTAAMVLPTDERQALLGCPDTRTRLEMARSFLVRENRLIGALSAVPAIDLIGHQGSPN